MCVSYLILVLRLEVGLYSTNERQQRCKHEVMNRDLLYCGCLLEGKKKKRSRAVCECFQFAVTYTHWPAYTFYTVVVRSKGTDLTQGKFKPLEDRATELFSSFKLFKYLQFYSCFQFCVYLRAREILKLPRRHSDARIVCRRQKSCPALKQAPPQLLNYAQWFNSIGYGRWYQICGAIWECNLSNLLLPP